MTESNPLFAGVALGVGIDVCWPAGPRRKGPVEHIVGWVGSFVKQQRFIGEGDLLPQFADCPTEVNARRRSRATRVISLHFSVVVGPAAAVVHDGHPSSMPSGAVGIAGILFSIAPTPASSLREAHPPRLVEPGARSTPPGHRVRHVAAVSGQRAKLVRVATANPPPGPVDRGVDLSSSSSRFPMIGDHCNDPARPAALAGLSTHHDYRTSEEIGQVL